MPTQAVNNEAKNTSLQTLTSKLGPLIPASAKAMLNLPMQPFVVILRQQQASVRQSNPLGFFSAAKKIIADNPKNLCKGTFPAVGKDFIKYSFYKVLVIQKTQSIVNNAYDWDRLPSHVSYPLKTLVAGGIAGSADTLLGGPLGLYVNYVTTSIGQASSAKFSDELKSQPGAMNKVRFLYRGAAAALIKNSLSFTLMFGTKEPIKQIVNTALKSSEKDTPKWYAPFCSAIMSGGLIALTTAPIDIIKTLKQMPGGNQQGTIELLKSNLVKHGMRGITAGLPTKFALLTMGWAMNFLLLECFSRSEHSDEPSNRPKLG